MAKHARIEIENTHIQITPRLWEDFHGVTLCFIALNEARRVGDFIDHHRSYVKNICAIDGGSKDNTFERLSGMDIDLRIVNFKGHFGDQKNRVIEMASTDWILLLDPDEKLSDKALQSIDSLINQDEYDCYFFPRKNTIDGVVDDSHGEDHQARLFRSYCRYVRPVHEELVGYKKAKTFDLSSGIYIEHSKEKSRHDDRNYNYAIFEVAYLYAISSPGCQLKDSFSAKFHNAIKTAEGLKKRLGDE